MVSSFETTSRLSPTTLGRLSKFNQAQILISPEVLVSDGAESTFVKRPPSDEANPNDFEFTIDVPIPMQIVIDTYDRGNEHGFSATVIVEVLGKIYSRSKNYKFGSEDISWHEVLIELPKI